MSGNKMTTIHQRQVKVEIERNGGINVASVADLDLWLLENSELR